MEKNPDCSFCAHSTKIININDKYRESEHGIIDVCNTFIINSKKISLNDIKNQPVGSGYMNLIGSRLVRMSSFSLDKIQYKEAFLWDNCQFYYLLLQGKMYFINRIMAIYQMTGTGSYSGINPLLRLEKFCSAHLDFNKETNFMLGDRIYQEIVCQINYNLNLFRNNIININFINANDNSTSNKSQEAKKSLLSIYCQQAISLLHTEKYKRLIKFFFPPVLFYFYRKWRNFLSRHLKRAY
jgi:hypothetical protein